MLTDLNKPQQEAVENTEGPLLILAGAGSGKTRVLAHRIAYILQEKLACPNEILAVTFTNKAAGEMKERVGKLAKQLTSHHKQPASYNQQSVTYNFPFVGTFHSICVKILRRDGHHIGIGSNFTIYDVDDQLSAIRQAMKELYLNPKEFNPKTIHSYISSAKSELITADLYKNFAKGHFQDAVGSVYPRYQAILKDNNALDFDDLLVRGVGLLRQVQEVLERYQNLFKYVLVDEYQDTNKVQYILVNLFAKKSRNICVVGDDDQAIYSWRGATIKNILSFEEDYPEAKVIKLEQNYRSTKKILDAAFEVIRHNQTRKAKKLWTKKDAGGNIQIYTAGDEQDESKFVAESIQELVEQKVDLNDIAILYRTNAQSRIMEEVMLSYGIPYQIFGSISFYQRKEIKDILAYLRVIYNPSDNVSLKRIINKPTRKIGTVTINKLKEQAKEKKVSMCELLLNDKNEEDCLQSAGTKHVQDFTKIIKDLKKASKKMKLTRFIEYTLERSGYLKWLDDGTSENESRIENIKELLSVASKYDDLESQTALAEFLSEVSLIEERQVKAQTKKDKDRVTLMTLHSAKGLEFENVFIIGMEEGLFPHSRSYTDPEEMEEERRLAYVGITRAREKLFLTHAESRNFFGSRQNNLPSRFLEDIPEEIVNRMSWNGDEEQDEECSEDFNQSDKSDHFDHINHFNLNKGDRVEHAEFGRGVILKVEENIVKVDFGPVEGVKQLALEYAGLNKF